MPLYSAYGLTISSEFPLTGLLATGTGVANVSILVAPPASPSTSDASAIQCVSAHLTSVRLTWGTVGDLLIESGQRITVVPAPNANPETLGLLLAGAGLGVLLHQRGLLVLHASGVRIGGRVVGFLGGKGWGKSTTAMALKDRGHEVVADEHLAISLDHAERAMVLPGSSPIKLWADALSSMGGDPSSSVPVRPGLSKYYAGSPVSPGHALPLNQLFLLDAGDQLSVEPVSRSEAFFGVVPHLYVCRFGTQFLQATGAATVFQQLNTLLCRVKVSRLVRRPDLAELPDVAKLVESHCIAAAT